MTWGFCVSVRLRVLQQAAVSDVGVLQGRERGQRKSQAGGEAGGEDGQVGPCKRSVRA